MLTRTVPLLPIFRNIWICILLLCASCGNPRPKEILGANHYFPITLGSQIVHLQLAVAEEEMRRGLMFRQSLPENHGMLFIYAYPRQLVFWMRNTRIPLDIGYFSQDGVLREIYRMYPHDETSVRSRRSDLTFALEMTQGWYSNKDVSPGAQLDVQELSQALLDRGFIPERFGIK